MISARDSTKIKGYYKSGVKSNRLLIDIFEEIQDMRINSNLQDPKIIKKLSEKENKVRKKVLSMLRRGEVKTADDFYRAALIFQHDNSFKGYALAIALSTVSYLLGERWGKSLSAAGIDRFLLSINQRQIFGTNLELVNNKWQPSPYREEINDKLREEYDIPPLEKLLEKVTAMGNSVAKH